MAVEVDGPSKANDNLQQIVKADRERHTSSTQAGSDGISFNKALYPRYLQRKENESNTSNRGNNPDKQSKQQKPVYQCYADEFEDESDEEDNLHSTAAIDSEQLSEFAEM